jgi:hypothetical protein
VRGDRAAAHEPDATHPHALFTAASLLEPIVASMQLNDPTFIDPVAAGVLAVSSGRLVSAVAALMGLSGVVIAGLALARSARRAGSDSALATRGAPGRAVVAMVMGLTGMILGGLVATTADGGVGTGNGRGGAFVAMVLGLIGTALGGVARARDREVA